MEMPAGALVPQIRLAREEDLPAVLRLVQAGSLRTEPAAPFETYLAAFREMQRSDGNRTWVAEHEGRVVGTFQLTFIRHLMRGGTLVAQVEAVHVEASLRGHGVGAQLMRRAIQEARAAGCSRIQLTSDKRREEAHRFYRRIGFAQSHEGFKLGLG